MFRTKRRLSIAPLPSLRLNDKEIMANEFDSQSILSNQNSITSVNSLANLLKEKMQVSYGDCNVVDTFTNYIREFTLNKICFIVLSIVVDVSGNDSKEERNDQRFEDKGLCADTFYDNCLFDWLRVRHV